MSYPLTDLDGVDEATARLLKRAGIRTTGALLEAAKDAKGRRALANRTGLDDRLLLKWANTADRMRIKGLGADYAALLHAAGVETVRELKHRNAARLARALADANAERKLVLFLPSEKAVTRWIEQAKTLPLKITY